MSTKDKEQQEANALLQQLRAAFPGNLDGDAPASEVTEATKKAPAASATGRAKGAQKSADKSASPAKRAAAPEPEAMPGTKAVQSQAEKSDGLDEVAPSEKTAVAGKQSDNISMEKTGKEATRTKKQPATPQKAPAPAAPEKNAAEPSAPETIAEKPSVAVSEKTSPEQSATEKTPVQKKPVSAAPAAILALTEDLPEMSFPHERPAKTSAKKAEEPEKKVEPTEKNTVKAERKAEPIAATAEPVKKDIRREPPGTTLPKATPNPFLMHQETVAPAQAEPSAKADTPAKADTSTKTDTSTETDTSAEKARVRPNTTKIPPRKRSGINTGAIRPRTEATAGATPAPRVATSEIPAKSSAKQEPVGKTIVIPPRTDAPVRFADSEPVARVPAQPSPAPKQTAPAQPVSEKNESGQTVPEQAVKSQAVPASAKPAQVSPSQVSKAAPIDAEKQNAPSAEKAPETPLAQSPAVEKTASPEKTEPQDPALTEKTASVKKAIETGAPVEKTALPGKDAPESATDAKPQSVKDPEPQASTVSAAQPVQNPENPARNPATAVTEPQKAPASEVGEEKNPPAGKSRPAARKPTTSSRRIMDFDAPASSTVVPIENTEAAETINVSGKKKSASGKRRLLSSFRRDKKTKKIVDESMDATAYISSSTGLSEDDITLIFELGYENELARVFGYEKLKELKYEHMRRTQTEAHTYSQAFGYRGREYTSATPREQVLAAYFHDRRNLILRIVLMTLFCVLTFFADFAPLLISPIAPYAHTLPFLFPLIGLVLFAAAVFLVRRRIFSGWRTFLRFAPSPYTAIAVAAPLMLAYSIGRVVLSLMHNSSLLPMNFAAALSLFLIVLCDALRITDEIRAFRMVSEPGNKTVLEESEPRKKRLCQGKRTVKILNDEAGEQLYRVRPTHEILGFFHRVNDLSAASTPFTWLTLIYLIGSAATGFAASLILHSAMNGILITAAALMFSIPASAIFLFFDPLRRANRRLITRRSVLVGEGSVNEYSGRKTVIFNDTETFKAKRQAQIDIQDADNFRNDMHLAGVLFRKLGGTLGTLGEAAPGQDDPADPPVEFVRLTENGVEALIDQRTRILAGDASFLAHSQVEVPKESTDRSTIRSRGVSCLYVSINGKLKLTYEISYRISLAFREVISLLAQTETTIAVQSYDPNLNDAFLHIGFADGDDVIRILKPAQFELPTPAEMTDTGAITLDGALATAYPLRAASLVVQTRRSGFHALLASILPGAVLAFLAVCFLPANLLPYLPLMAVGYRALWFAVSWLISTLSLRRRALFEDTGENLANTNR